MENDKPLITTITVTLNNSKELEKTIQSVLSQTYSNVESIIIDGGSTDNTSVILKNFAPQITKWVSEPDKGVYDAMNKGVQLSTGEWVIFMNSGDTFANKKVIHNIFILPRQQVDIIYGHHKILYEDGFEGIHFAGETNNLWKGMVFCHQAAFIRKNILRKQPFNLQEPIGADFQMIFNAYLTGAIFHKENIIIAKITNQGISDTKRLQSIFSHWRTTRKHTNTLKVLSHYSTKIILMFFRQITKKILPAKYISRIIQSKYN